MKTPKIVQFAFTKDDKDTVMVVLDDNGDLWRWNSLNEWVKVDLPLLPALDHA